MSSNPVVVVKDRAKSVLASRHPWLRAESLQPLSSEVEDGQVVEVMDQEGSWLARGIYNSASFLRVRLYSWDPNQQIDHSMWENRLSAAIQLRRQLGMIRPDGACRLVFSESDQLSGLIVDQYADHIVISLTAKATLVHRKAIIDAFEKVFTDFPIGCLSVRADKNMLAVEGMEPIDEVVIGAYDDHPIEILENGIRFQVHTSGGQKTGFYLDQRDNREFAGRLAFGEMLDVCCYSGGFALAAAKHGKTTSITAVDSSMKALEQAEANVSLNGFEAFDFVKADCFSFLDHLVSEGKKFDTIVLDPPKFAGRRNEVRSALRAYHRLNRLAINALNPGGILVTCSCSGRVSAEEFQAAVLGASRRCGREVQLLEIRGASADHPTLLSCQDSSYLKCMVCRVF